jgi:hypothetical protein
MWKIGEIYIFFFVQTSENENIKNIFLEKLATPQDTFRQVTQDVY